MDALAIASGGIGILGFVFSIIVAGMTGSWVPFALGLGFGTVMVLWKYVLNELTRKTTTTQAITYLQTIQGKEQIDMMRDICETMYGGRKIMDGDETYIELLKRYLSIKGVPGLHNYRPENYIVLEPYGIFVMEVDDDPKWDRKRFYAILSTSGENAGLSIGAIHAPNFEKAIDKIAEMGSLGLLNAKFMEVKSPIMRKQIEASMSGAF